MFNLAKTCCRKFNSDALSASLLPRKVKRRLRTFTICEDGTMTTLTVSFMLIMLIVAGIGLAFMRQEMTRARLTSVTDIAALAGAGMPQGSTTPDEIKAVVEDYFDKNGLASSLNAIDTDGQGVDDIIATANATEVTVSARATINTFLLQLVGVDTLSAVSAGTAKFVTPKLEISLVLDVSGSMGSTPDAEDVTKLVSLKAAATDFVDTMINSAGPGDVSISLIPFSWGVTPSDTIFSALNIDQTHDYSNCIVLNDSDFNSTTIDPTTSYRQQIYTSLYPTGQPFGGFKAFNGSTRSCYTDDYFEIMPYSTSISALTAKINSLTARGNTSAQLGMKWGAALLDPAFQSVSAELRANGEISNQLTNVPASWTEPEVLKIIVMMSDGKNTPSRYFNDPNLLNDTSVPVVPEAIAAFDYRGPSSDLFVVEYTESGGTRTADFLRNPDADEYFDINRVEDDAADDDWLTRAEFDNLSATFDGYVSTNQLSWEVAWGQMTPWDYNRILGISTSQFTSRGAFGDYNRQSKITGGMKDTRMENICSAVKTRGILVYTIGFDISSGGNAENQLANCSTSASTMYFPVADGPALETAFGAIASNVQNLRLTQ